MRKIDPVAALAHALGTLGKFWPEALRIGLPWLGIVVLANAGLWWWSGGTSASPMAEPGLADVAVALLSLIAVSAMAMKWHRFLLRDEMPDAAGIVRLDPPLWRYAFYLAVILFLTVFLPALLMIMVASAAPAYIIATVIPAFLASILALRLALVLPAIALGRKDVGFKQALDASAFNLGPLAFLTLLNACILLAALLIVNTALSFVFNGAPQFAPAAMFILALPLNLFLTLFSVSLTTSLYGFFMENRSL